MKKSRSFGLDPRLLVGLVLVVGSVSGVYILVDTADETQALYVARDDLVPGDYIHASDLEVQQIRMDDATIHYLAPGLIPIEGVRIARSIGAGELIPASAVGSAGGLTLTSMVIAIEGALPQSVQFGSLIDVWAVHEDEDGANTMPVAIVSEATVVRLIATDSIVSSAIATGIEILVPRNRVARVLAASANGDVLSILPVNLP